MIFIAPFPTEKNIKDGLVQRVKAIDEHFKDVSRTYLEISFSKFIIPQIESDGVVTIVRTNYFTFYWAIYLMKSNCVYCHTIFNFLKITPFILLKKFQITLDVHGTVPEERKLETGNKFFEFLF